MSSPQLLPKEGDRIRLLVRRGKGVAKTRVLDKVADPVKAVTTVEDYRQALYREAQLALRAVVGTRELDVLLGDKDAVARSLAERRRPCLSNDPAGHAFLPNPCSLSVVVRESWRNRGRNIGTRSR